MTNQIIAIYDTSEDYARRLGDYLHTAKNMDFDIRVFTNESKLSSYCEKESVFILLIGEGAINQVILSLKVAHFICLNETGAFVGNVSASINKYQSADGIFRNIMNYLSQAKDTSEMHCGMDKDNHIIGFFSPIHRCGQSTAALILGQILSKSHKTIYLSFEPFSGLKEMLADTQKSGTGEDGLGHVHEDICDLLYCAKNFKDKLRYKTASMARELNGLDIILPVFSAEDLKFIEYNDWKLLINALTEHTEYRFIILDLSETMKGIFEIMSLCEKIYTIGANDNIAKAKIDQYEKLIESLKKSDIKSKSEKWQMPAYNGANVDFRQGIEQDFAYAVRKLALKDWGISFMNEYEELKNRLLINTQKSIDFGREVTDEEVKEIIAACIYEAGDDIHIPFAIKEKISKELFFTVRKLDILQELMEDSSVTEIMINGTDNIFIEQSGRLFRWEGRFSSKERLEDVIQQIVAKCNRIVNEASPIVDARLENGSRVNIVLPPIALNGPIITIRRFSDTPIGMKELVSIGSIPESVCEFIKKLVQARYNIFISGGTGSGKTTFLNALSGCIPKEERIITIEDSAELQIQGIPNLVRLETRNANVEECKEIDIRSLIRSALRMRPDRIIVGEVRGGEAMDLLQCLNTGHDGSFSTGHANSARDMLSRLETMALMGMDLPLQAIRRQIASGIDIIIHLGRLRDKTRKVLEISEIIGYEGDEIKTAALYEFIEKDCGEKEHVEGALVKKNELRDKTKWRAAGIAL